MLILMVFARKIRNFEMVGVSLTFKKIFTSPNWGSKFGLQKNFNSPNRGSKFGLQKFSLFQIGGVSLAYKKFHFSKHGE